MEADSGYKPAKFWPGDLRTCVGCGEVFARKVGNAGTFCSVECYQTPAHLRRKRAEGRLTVRDVAELERHAKDLLRRRLRRRDVER